MSQDTVAGLEKYFLMADADTPRALRVRPVGEFPGHALLSGERRPRQPLLFEVSGGIRPMDLIGTEFAGVYLISPRFQAALSHGSFSGWGLIEASVSGTTIERYRLLVISGRCGPIEDSRSERLLIPSPSGGEAVGGWRGLLFDPDTWDGSDLFLPRNTFHTIVVDRVRDVVIRERLTNVTFERITEIERLWSVA